MAASRLALGAKSLHAAGESRRSGQPAVSPLVPPRTVPFSPADVRLLDGPFKQSRDAAARYLLSLDVDRLLALYRIEAGLKQKAPQFLGWETDTLPGVALAFYLSGISRMALNMEGWEGDEFRWRLNYILDELEACQKVTGGYLLGTHNAGRSSRALREREDSTALPRGTGQDALNLITLLKKPSPVSAMLIALPACPRRYRLKCGSGTGWTGICRI